MLQLQSPFAQPSNPFLSDRSARHVPAWDAEREERQLVTMLTAYRLSGGVVSGDELATLLRTHHDQPVSVVARWVVRRSILSFSWRGQTLIPLFQFERDTLVPRDDLMCIVRELSDAFDNWEIGLWFAQPNSWLDGETPIAAFRLDPESVLRAAQADRFIALG